jgi:hypothetical protein
MRRVIRGIVMEISPNSATVMTNDGEFVRVKKPSSNIILGQEITSAEYLNSRPNFIKYGVLAAAIMLMLIPFTYFKQAYATVGYVNVDINPSLEMAINKYNKVNSVVPLNDDAVKFIDNMALKGLDNNEALDRIITTAKTMGYISNEKENNIEIAIVNLNGNKLGISEKYLVKQAEKAVTDIDVDATIKVQKADEKAHDEAKKENVSTNKYLNKTGGSDKDTIKINVKKSDGSGEKNQDKDKENGNPQNDKSSEKNGNTNTQKSENNNGNSGNGASQNSGNGSNTGNGSKK